MDLPDSKHRLEVDQFANYIKHVYQNNNIILCYFQQLLIFTRCHQFESHIPSRAM